ncbi:MAG: hypothetical protein J6S67_08375 [Methanobrevibacter sp.]|nr:hypothetical protein [Methanobrevibacter sp.]
MTIKERLDALRAKLKAKIKPESTADEISAIDAEMKELDSIEEEYNNLNTKYADLQTEHGKFKDVIVNMVLKQGNQETPVDDIDGSKPVTTEELLEKYQKEQDKQNKEDK